MQSQEGMLVVVSGPAGAGKGTLVKRLIKEDANFHFSVSVTTRPPRASEKEGVDYHYISEEAYDDLIAQDAFLEYAGVHGKRYGSLKSEVLPYLAKGQHVVMDIDVQGARKIMEQFPHCVSVFILPQSFRELRARLEGRGSETPEQVERRMRNARAEVAEQPHYQYTIVNRTGAVEEAYAQLRAIIVAEAHRTARFSPTVTEA